MKHAFRNRQSGFTLIEVVAASAILLLALAAGYEGLRVAHRRFKNFSESAREESNARRVLERLARDLRCAVLVPDSEMFFAGRREEGHGDRLDFIRADEGRYAEISYLLQSDSGTGKKDLTRRRETEMAGDPLSGGESVLLCRNVAGFKLRYFNGETWLDEWGWNAENQRPTRGIRGLPQLVSIELSLARAAGEPPLKFSQIVPVMTALLNRPRGCDMGGMVIALWLVAMASSMAYAVLGRGAQEMTLAERQLDQAKTLPLLFNAAANAAALNFSDESRRLVTDDGEVSTEIVRQNENEVLIGCAVQADKGRREIRVGWKRMGGRWRAVSWEEM